MVTTAFDAWARNTQAIATEVADYSKKSFENSGRRTQTRSECSSSRSRPWSIERPREAYHAPGRPIASSAPA
jgi:hypothetical protein